MTFDATKHLSEASIRRRAQERQKLQELELQREEQKRREREAEERRRAEAAQVAQRAAQAARNSARSKEHLLPSGGKAGEVSVAVPGDVMEMYRMMMPGASEAEIIAHYNRMQREMKK